MNNREIAILRLNRQYLPNVTIRSETEEGLKSSIAPSYYKFGPKRRQESGTIAGRTARCRCQFLYVSHFTTTDCSELCQKI